MMLEEEHNSNTVPDQKDVLWFAGFFDGEGCVQLHRKLRKSGLPSYELMLSVSGTHYPSIKRILDIWQRGRIDRHHENRISTRKEAWNWICYGHNALFVLDNILPFSVTKRNDILIGITFQNWKSYEVSIYGKSNRPESSYDKEGQFKSLLSTSHDEFELNVAKEIDSILKTEGLNQLSLFG